MISVRCLRDFLFSLQLCTIEKISYAKEKVVLDVFLENKSQPAAASGVMVPRLRVPAASGVFGDLLVQGPCVQVLRRKFISWLQTHVWKVLLNFVEWLSWHYGVILFLWRTCGTEFGGLFVCRIALYIKLYFNPPGVQYIWVLLIAPFLCFAVSVLAILSRLSTCSYWDLF